MREGRSEGGSEGGREIGGRGEERERLSSLISVDKNGRRGLLTFSLFLWLFGSSVSEGGAAGVHGIAGTKDGRQTRATVFGRGEKYNRPRHLFSKVGTQKSYF